MNPRSPGQAPPGPGTLDALLRIRRQGFLEATRGLWARHGDVFQVRLGPRRLVFALHPDAVRHVCVENRDAYDKVASYRTVRQYLTGDGLVGSRGALWRRQRKLMAPFFTPKAIRAYAETIRVEGEAARGRWAALAASGRVVDMGEEMMRITAAIILRTMFSTDSDEDVVRLKGDVEVMIRFANDRAGLPVPDWVPTPGLRAYRAARDRVDRSIEGVIEQRRGLPEGSWPDDLLTRLMRARDDNGESMAESLLRDESVTLFFAGHETTARVLSAVWFVLATEPDVARRLHEELDAEVGPDAVPTMADLPRLPFALRVIKETLRLYPPAPFYVRDATVDDELGGFAVGEGSAVMLSPYLTHRHPDFWPDPERFDPDRWAPEAESGRHPGAYHPFALGPRFCIGMNFALVEMHLLLATLARGFAPTVEPGFDPGWTMEGLLVMGNGLPMTIVGR